MTRGPGDGSIFGVDEVFTETMGRGNDLLPFGLPLDLPLLLLAVVGIEGGGWKSREAKCF
jgi:hypothetical protein